MSDQPYADAVGALLDQGYRLEDLTQSAVIHTALDRWLAKQIKAAIDHHAAVTGNGHQPNEHCDAWHALQGALTMMHDASHPFVSELLAEKQGSV
jgi:hypothetical protein